MTEVEEWQQNPVEAGMGELQKRQIQAVMAVHKAVIEERGGAEFRMRCY